MIAVKTKTLYTLKAQTIRYYTCGTQKKKNKKKREMAEVKQET